jgi:hypothetical protein
VKRELGDCQAHLVQSAPLGRLVMQAKLAQKDPEVPKALKGLGGSQDQRVRMALCENTH